MHEELEKELDAMMEMSISSLERLANGEQMDRMAAAVATAARKYYDAFAKAGFNNEHAIALTAACVSSHTNGGE